MSLELPQGSQVSCHELLPQLPSVFSQPLDTIEGQMGGCARIYAIFILVIWTAFTSFIFCCPQGMILGYGNLTLVHPPAADHGLVQQSCLQMAFQSHRLHLPPLSPPFWQEGVAFTPIFQKVKGSSGLPSTESVRTASSPRPDRQRSKWLQMWIKETCDNLRISWYIFLVCWEKLFQT